MSAPWPDMTSTHRAGETLRGQLDYLVWISGEMLQLGFHAGADQEAWRERVHRAYAALFTPMIPGSGDPYPPDVPPAKNPGIWPDVPSSHMTGMTLRHQLTVIGRVADDLRNVPWLHARAQEIAEWDRRLSLARAALDHGAALKLPPEAKSTPSKETLDAAAARDQAIKAHARRRSRQIDRMLRTPAKKAAKKAKAPPKATAKPAPAPSKKAATKKAATRPKAPAKAKSRAQPGARKAASTKKARPKKR